MARLAPSERYDLGLELDRRAHAVEITVGTVTTRRP